MTQDKGKLARHIGLFALIMYGVGDILGAGIYGLVGKVAGEMGSAAWMAFLVSALAAALTGLSYASLGSRYPKAGGASYVVHRAFGFELLSSVVGLAVLASGLTSMATASRIFAGYFSGWFPGLAPWIIVLGFVVVLATIVFWGIKESLWVNVVCTTVELGGLLLILVTGASFLGDISFWDATTPTNPTGHLTLPLMLSGAVLTFYSFIGFEDILNVAEEVKEPKRNIPIGLLAAVGISSLVYMGISLVAVSVLPAAQLANSSQPLVDVAAKSAPWFPSPLFSLISMFAVANTALLNLIMSSRLSYGMAEQGLLPKLFSKVHARTKTPHVAVFMMAGLFLILALSGDVAALAKSTSVLLLLCFTLMNVSLIVLKKKEKGEGSFEIPRFIPFLGAGICMAMLSQAESAEWTRAGVILLVIFVVSFVKSRSGSGTAAKH